MSFKTMSRQNIPMNLLQAAGMYFVLCIQALLLICGYLLYYVASEADSRAIRQVAMSLWVLSFSFMMLPFMDLALI